MKKSSSNHLSPFNDAIDPLPLKRIGQEPLGLKNKMPQTEKGSDIWLLTLSDLLLLLMIFFVILFGMLLQRQDYAQRSAAVQRIAAVEPKKNIIETQPAIASDLTLKEATSSLENDLAEILGQDEAQKEVTIERHADRLVLTFPERIVFDPGQAKLKPSAQPILDKVASFVLEHPRLNVEVQGHADNRPINNMRYPSNWELSVDRATQVARTLIFLGVAPTQLSVKGFGEYRALYPNDSDLNRGKNRRVEIQFFLTPQS